MSDIKLEALDNIDESRLLLTMADIKVEVSASAWETTNPSTLFSDTDIKQEPLTNDYNKHLSSNSTGMNDVNSTEKTSSSTLFTTTNIKCEPSEIDLNEQFSYHNINLQEDNFLNKNGKICSLTEKYQLNINDCTKEYDKGSFSDGQFYFTKNKDLDMENSILGNDKLPSGIQLLHNTNRILNEGNEFDNTENKMADTDHSANLSMVQNQIKMENIDQTSENLHEQKQIEAEDINQTLILSKGSFIKMENTQQTSDLLHGQKQTQIQVLTNENFTDYNYIENQTYVIEIKTDIVQEEVPTLNYYQGNIGEFDQTTSTLYFHVDNSFVEGDHNNYNMPMEERKTETQRKEIKAYRRRDKNILRAPKEQKSILKEQRKEEKLKTMEGKRKVMKVSLQPVPCPICGKMIRPMHMSRHKSAQHSGESFLCKFCGMLFQSRKELSHHEKLNHDVGPKESKECDICHKTFKSRFVMRDHRRRIHINKWKRTFVCSICGKKFPSSYYLKKHTLTHSDERPFKCCYCNAKFKIRSYLVQHKKNRHHIAGKVFPCTESGCEKEYYRKDSWRRHMKWHQKCNNATLRTSPKEDVSSLRDAFKEEIAGDRNMTATVNDHNYPLEIGVPKSDSPSELYDIRKKRCGMNCCVPRCPIYDYPTINGKKIRYHQFPSDETIRKQWVAKTRVDIGKTFQLNSRKTVCSLHFQDSDYVGFGFWKRKLKKDAVPSKFDCWNDIPFSSTPLTKREKREKAK